MAQGGGSIVAARLATLLILACPPAYLAKRGKLVGCVVLGVPWLAGAGLVLLGLAALARDANLSGVFMSLYLGLFIWLLDVGVALLWSWWPIAGAAVIVTGALALVLLPLLLMSPSRRLGRDQEAFDKMRSAIKSYRQQHGQFPSSRTIVEALVENRPWSCAGQDWVYDPDTGTARLAIDRVEACR